MTLLNSHPLVLDKQLAVEIGLNEALVLQQVHYWLEINKKNNRNFHEGRYWTYNTINEWQEEFPFWSNSTIKRIFKKLRDMKLIEVDNFNVYQMDRTLWYTINYEELTMITKDNEDNNTRLDKNDQMISSKEDTVDIENEPMEKTNITSPLPEITTETTTDISNQSISPSKNRRTKNIKDDRLMDIQDTPYENFQDKYEKIISNCELYAIDEKYRKAVAHAIKLLLFDIEKSNSIRVGDNYIPVQIVKNDIRKLNFFVIEHAINKFKESSRIREIRNPLGYLKVLIYNSINEIDVDMDSKLRYGNLIE
jgi:hypothetical protein